MGTGSDTVPNHEDFANPRSENECFMTKMIWVASSSKDSASEMITRDNTARQETNGKNCTQNINAKQEKNLLNFTKMKESTKVLNEDPVLRRIMDLLKKQNRMDKDLIDYLGLSNGVFTKWKYMGGRSYMKYIRKIAEYLDTSTGYLLKGIDDDLGESGLTEEEANVLQLFRQLDKDAQLCATEVLRRFVGG